MVGLGGGEIPSLPEAILVGGARGGKLECHKAATMIYTWRHLGLTPTDSDSCVVN